MQIRLKLACAAVLAILSTPVLALTSQLQAKELLNASGLQELVEKIPASTNTSFQSLLSQDGLPEPFKDVQIADLKAAISDAFNVDRFEQQLSNAVVSSIDETELSVLMQWYESELGQKFKEAELKYSLLNNDNDFEQFQATLAYQEIDPARSSLMRQLDNTMLVSESAVDMLANINIAFNVSLSSIIPESQRLGIEEIKQRVSAQKPGIVESYRQYSHDLLMYMYQDFSLLELNDLNTVLASEAGQEFVHAANSGINRGMFGASLELGQSIASLVQSQQAGPGI